MKFISCLCRFLLLFLVGTHLLQANEIDSLQNLLTQKDLSLNEKARLHLHLGQLYLSSNPRLVLQEVKEVLLLKDVQSQYIMKAHEIIGDVYYIHGAYLKGISYHLKRLEDAKSLRDTTQLIEAMNAIAKGYFGLKKSDEASNYWIEALYLAEKIDDQSNIQAISLDLVRYYRVLGEYHIALNYLNRIETEFHATSNPKMKGIFNLEKGLLFLEQNNQHEALKYIEIAHQTFSTLEPCTELIQSIYYLGLIHGNLKHYEQAFIFFDEALKLAKTLNANKLTSQIYESYATIYEQKGNLEQALYYFKKFKKYEERYYSEKRLKHLANMQVKHEVEQKEQEILELKTEKLLHQQQIEHKQYLNTFLVIGVFLSFALFGLALFYARFKHRANNKLQTQNIHIQAQKEEIETQKESIDLKNALLEQTNQKLTDSIRYAYTIQRAVLPHESDLQEVVPDLFINYLPKDIVSGDFYWITTAKDYVFIAVGDCTGHGVPGGFMVMIAETLLDEIVRLSAVYNPSEILEEMNQRLRSMLKQDKKMNDDGMDIIICRLTLKNKKSELTNHDTELVSSSAKRPLYYLEPPYDEIHVIKGTNRTIGGAFKRKKTKPFKNHKIELPSNSMVYLTSDGFVDQKGAEGVKYGSLRFKKLLRQIAKVSFDNHQQVLEDEFRKHKSHQNQIDDVTVLGFKL